MALLTVVGHIASHGRSGAFVAALERVGMIWMGVIFLSFALILMVDVVTGFGVWCRRADAVRSGAFAAAVCLSVVGMIQAARGPVIRREIILLPNLPSACDGLRVAFLSDLHIDARTSRAQVDRWVNEVNALSPDMIAVGGDVLDTVERMDLAEPFRRWSPRLGTFAVTGNHDFYVGLTRARDFFSAAGFHTLSDAAVEVSPGLWIAGIDDLAARRHFGDSSDPYDNALSFSGRGTRLFLCHTPLRLDDAAARGVDVMLCGHTHGGQIWPFGGLVKLFFPVVSGRAQVGGMTLLVSRGAGTWGPPMRLFRRGEIIDIRLQAASTPASFEKDRPN
jgi:predicted MPP superfamily phosphohydrolase